MSARHFLQHLALAYNHFHPIGEHRKFEQSLESFEQKQLRAELLSQLKSLELRCHSAMAGRASEELYRVMARVRSLQRAVEV